MAVKPELREQVDAEIRGRPEVALRDMMGTTSYVVRGRMFAFWVADGLVAKLNERTRRELVDQKAAAPFLGPQGRNSGEWTRLPLGKKGELSAVLEGAKAAYEYVKGGVAAQKKRKKKGRRP